MISSSSLLDRSHHAGLKDVDPLGRLPLFNSFGFETAIDGSAGTWGLSQQFWAQEFLKDSKGNYTGKSAWHADGDGTVMTQVILSLDSDKDWCVVEENQFAILPDGKSVYLKYSLLYAGCKFCPAVLGTSPDRRSNQGVATWTMYDSAGKVLSTAPIKWAYNVVVNAETGQIDEAYYQRKDDLPISVLDLAYWRRTYADPGVGDVKIEDILSGITCSRRN